MKIDIYSGFLGAGKIFVFSPLLVDNGGQWWTMVDVHYSPPNFFSCLKKVPYLCTVTQRQGLAGQRDQEFQTIKKKEKKT